MISKYGDESDHESDDVSDDESDDESLWSVFQAAHKIKQKLLECLPPDL